MLGSLSTETASKINFILLAVKRFCEVAAILVLFFMMTLTCADVVARYLFNSPIRGAFELTEIFLAILVFLSFPIAAISDGHIKVDLVPSFGTGILSRVFQFTAFAIVLVVFGVLTTQLWQHSLKLKLYEQVTNSLEIPLYYVAFIATACCLLSAIVMIASGLKKYLELKK